MHPLFFLVSRTLVNGVVRSFSSPTRALGTLFFLGTQFLWLGNMLFRAAVRPSDARLPMNLPGETTELVTAVVFGFFALSSWVWGFGMFTAPFGFQKADSDCLFPTPVDNRHILSLHLVRNTLFKLLMPLVSTAVLWRPVTALGRQVASGEVSMETVQGVFRAAILTYLFLMTLWTVLRFASVLATAGTEKPRMVRRGWFLGATYVLTLSTAGAYVVLLVQRAQSAPTVWREVVHVMADPSTWWLQPVGALGALTSLGPVSGQVGVAGLALLGLVAITSLGFRVCYSHANRLCELGLQSIDTYEKYRSARRGDSSTEQLEARARQGGLKGKTPKFLAKWTQLGEGAFVWRELVLMWRTSKASLLMMNLTVIAITFMFAKLKIGVLYDLPIPLTCALLGGMLSAGLAQQGMKEFLKRSDLIRPLPVSTSKLLRLETAARTATVVLNVLCASVTWAFFEPSSVVLFPVNLVFSVGTAYALVSVVNLASILLPDIEDPTQRSFRQLVVSVGLLLVLGTLAGGYFWLTMLTHGLVASGLAVGLLGVALGIVFLLLADVAYRGYVPTD